MGCYTMMRQQHMPVVSLPPTLYLVRILMAAASATTCSAFISFEAPVKVPTFCPLSVSCCLCTSLSTCVHCIHSQAIY